LLQAQRAGWLQGKLPEYLALFAPHAQVLAARGPDPSTHDVAFSAAAYRALMHYQSQQPSHIPFPSGYGSPLLVHEDAQWSCQAKHCTLTLVRRFRGLSALERVHETFTFTLYGTTWRIAALRYYPLSAHDDNDAVYDMSRLPELDTQADDPSLSDIKHAHALFGALRYAQAAAAFGALAAAEPRAAEAWVTFGYAALFAGDGARAEHAFTHARGIDPQLLLPAAPTP
jgi:hypothetical protein